MALPAQPFGGDHTRRKLDVLANYLDAYVTVMKKQRFDLHYVDGFAGSGASSPKDKANEALMPGLFETKVITRGSPLRALDVDPPFDHFLFIDNKPKNVRALQDHISGHRNGAKAEVASGDANEAIAEFCNRISADRSARAVVFLDPYGRSVHWDTILKLAATEKVDLWYLVPVHAMSRQVSQNGQFLETADITDRMCGSTKWREIAVRKVDSGGDLFGSFDERVEKAGRAKEFSEMFRDLLKAAFGGRVAETYLKLGRGNLHEFSLMFACANPSPKAYGAALRIANHLLRTS